MLMTIEKTSTKAGTGTSRTLGIFLVVIVVVLGAWEGWYTRTDYTTDAISYLDIIRAIPHWDWKLMLNPQWSIGYPLLVALIRPLFPAGPFGEWNALHALNLLIYTATYFAFLFFLRTAASDPDISLQPDKSSRQEFLLIAGTCIFLCTELCMDAASRVGPDTLVTCLFFLAVTLIVRILRQPQLSLALLLGVVLGAAYWTKAIFLPLSIVLLLVAAYGLWRNKKSFALLPLTVIVLAAFVIPYAAGLSWVMGRFTLGEAGSLNYAFHVNHIPHWVHWHGGPAGYGMPIHPSRMLMDDPPLFEFGEPFHTTYPPFGSLAYWYEGYHHFFSIKWQVRVAIGNTGRLILLLVTQPITYAFAACVALMFLAERDWRKWLSRMLHYWPFIIPALVGICLYITVHLEGRYVASFLTVLAALPFVAFCASTPQITQRLRTSLLVILILGTAANLLVVDREAVTAALHHRRYTDNPQWVLGAYLKQSGLKPGDKVAGISYGPNARATWASIDGARMVAEIGNDAYDATHPNPDSWYRFWHVSPATQQQALSLFKQAGAVVVVTDTKDPKVTPPGWIHVGNTDYWIYWLRDN